MYRKHFALTALPFDLTPPPDALFAAASLTEAAARLKHLLELRAIGLITGEAGLGLAPRSAARSPPTCIRDSIGCSTFRCPPAT